MQETIEDYERSTHWKNFSKKILSDPMVTCDICGKPHWAVAKRTGKKHKKGQKYSLRRFACHHKHYRHPYKETREDIMVLCARCHITGHSIADLARNAFFGPVYEVWCDITGWESEKNDFENEV